MIRWTCVCVAALALVGCAAVKLEPGAERVTVTTNPEQVRGMELVSSGYAQIGNLKRNQMERAFTFARNYTQKAGGETALIKTESGRKGLYVTVEAYRKRSRSE